MATKNDKKELTARAKGMHDILPKEYLLRKMLIEKAASVASFYGFRPIQTPFLEKTELFTTALGETTDVVEKEMYDLKTKGGDKLVLRPEGTAPIMRAYLEYGMHTKPQPVMFYYEGSFFRHENPQKGRRREHQQFGLEILGEEDSIVDALVIKTFSLILEEITGFKEIAVCLNSVGCKQCRPAYKKELLAYYRRFSRDICKNCKERMRKNPLRLLDCKEECCAETKQQAPQIINFLCRECADHFKNLLEALDASETPYRLNHSLVRGLDYYTRTVFEFFVKDSDMAVCGGGRYDGLAEILGGRRVSAVGGAMGIERILEIMPGDKKTVPGKKEPKIFFGQLGKEARRKSLTVLEMLRKAKIPVKHSLSKDSLKSQLKIADKLKVPYALILGQKECIENTVIIRDMETASQETIPLSKLTNYLKNKL